jgi:hypothetical protein
MAEADAAFDDKAPIGRQIRIVVATDDGQEASETGAKASALTLPLSVAHPLAVAAQLPVAKRPSSARDDSAYR